MSKQQNKKKVCFYFINSGALVPHHLSREESLLNLKFMIQMNLMHLLQILKASKEQIQKIQVLYFEPILQEKQEVLVHQLQELMKAQ